MIKKFKLYVGKTIVRRARAQVLKDIMGDHIVKFGRILDYKDEMLRINLRTSYVVKLGEPDALGKSVFQSFYICFDTLRRAWAHPRKCISLDDCFLKMFEKENRNSWTMFVKYIKDDLGFGDGEDLILITDMHKLDIPSSKIYSTGQAKVTRSSDVTSDIGYTPSTTSKLK
ncbi:hypothetical protein MTR67_044711 [Solanum verrucosum]|uniref:Uncharacterized protein n=1 Tax=Solanum verrucosum TaxID=315347 RepID=A0AAF0UUG8_SOLVR|nr:hypothetical protein MTR67_044711 [Solanum verrucosum]